MRYRIKDCFNTEDFRKLAKKKLPFPVFHYIDGAADDEVTLKRNTQAFEDVDLVPNVLKGVEDIDICLLYTYPSQRDATISRMQSYA